MISLKIFPNMKNRIINLKEIYSIRGVDFESKKLKEKIKNKENITILDVRTSEEYNRGKIDGAANIYIDDLRKNLDKLDAGSEVIIYCRSGYRAYQAFRILKNMGFKNIKILNGSYLSWIRKI